MKPEPQPEQTIDVPEPPGFITGYAADEWWRTAPELHRLGLLTRMDISALAAYCHAFGQWQMAAEALATMQANDPIMNGMIIKTKFGDAAMNPLVSIARKHAGDVIRFSAEFGLTPVARTRLAVGGYVPASRQVRGAFALTLFDQVRRIHIGSAYVRKPTWADTIGRSAKGQQETHATQKKAADLSATFVVRTSASHCDHRPY